MTRLMRSVLLTVLVTAGCGTAGFRSDKLTRMDGAIDQAIAGQKLPGAVVWLERDGRSYHRAYGQRAVFPAGERMSEDTIFDAASLTKVIATTPAVMKLIEGGQVDLDAPIGRYVAACDVEDKAAVTVRHLLTHSSGLSPFAASPKWQGHEAAIRVACEKPPTQPPGETFRYTDVNFVLLGEIVRAVSGRSLADFVAAEVHGPLKMNDTGYLPPRAKLGRIAPTERVGDQVFRGVVHDPLARQMGGVAGHAGLFTTAADLARFARMLLGEGTLEGVRVFAPGTVRLMTSVQSPPQVTDRRGLGWDIDSSHAGPRGRHFPIGSYGHTGWTGTSIWIDPFSHTFLVILSNRNHPSEAGAVKPLRHELATLAAEATGFDFTVVRGLPPAVPAEGAADGSEPAQSGIDVLVRDGFAPLRGLRVGLITNHTGHDRTRNPTVDLLFRAPGVKLAALFGPEHGIRGSFDSKVADSVDEQTGLPVYSLYGETRQPRPEHLKDLDALVFDIQDIGCRFYTYGSTLGLSMEAAGKARLKFFVLDRPLPIGGVAVQGPVRQAPSNFTGFHPVAVRPGMTIGELAQMYNEERGFKVDLTVIKVDGWRRAAWFDETGLPWTNPSPNMRTLTAAAFYPGVGLLETTALSVGRGTDTPFEVVGAPYVDDVRLAAELGRMGLPGVRFTPVRFTPVASKFKDTPCSGIRISLVDRQRLDAVAVGLAIAITMHRLYPNEFDVTKFDRLLGHPPTIEAIRAGKTLEEIRRSWEPELKEFLARRERYLLYR